MAVDYIVRSNVLGPSAGYNSLGNVGSLAPNEVGDMPQGGNHVDEALQIGGQGSPLMGLAVFGVLAAGLYLIAKHTGEDGSFSSIKGSAYNALFISLVAVTGIPVWKFLFTRLKVPGVSTWVL